MRVANKWEDYKILDTSEGEKLECWGDVVLIRPDPQIIWNTSKTEPGWTTAHGRYRRSNKGGGEWEDSHTVPKQWVVSYEDLRFNIRLTGFKHTGLFPEQAVNWEFFQQKIKESHRPLRILNLFAYTGGATVACAMAGAEVCHVDASKGMVAWAKENVASCGLRDRPIRYIVDDCEKFVMKEIRRQNFYDAVIMDPPSYGRGPGGEVWKLEQRIYQLLMLCRDVLVDQPLFFALNSYTTGLSPAVMAYLLGVTIQKKFGGEVVADEIGLPVQSVNFSLPCGCTALWSGH